MAKDSPAAHRVAYNRIKNGLPGALESLDEILGAIGQEWQTPLRDGVYTVFDAVAAPKGLAIQSQMMGRLEQAFPAGHEAWRVRGYLMVNHGVELFERFKANGADPYSTLEDGRSLVRQTLLACNDKSPSDVTKAFAVFDHLREYYPIENMDMHLADCWQYAIIQVRPIWAEKLMSITPIDVNARMLGPLDPKNVEQPAGQDPFATFAKYTESYYTGEERFRNMFRILAFAGMDLDLPWSQKTPGSRRDWLKNLPQVQEWEQECKREMMEARLQASLPEVSRARQAPRF